MKMVDDNFLIKNEENMNKAITAMFSLWKTGVANLEQMSELRKSIIERYSGHVEIPKYLIDNVI